MMIQASQIALMLLGMLVSADQPVVDGCSMVRAVLEAGWGDQRDRLLAPGLEQGCALKNGLIDGIVLVDAVRSFRDKKGNAGWKPVLKPKERCGHDIMSLPASSVPGGEEKLIHVVRIELSTETADVLSFREYLRVVSNADPFQERSAIGTSCLPAADGRLWKKDGEWVGRILKSIETDESAFEPGRALELLRAEGVAPRRWPALRREDSVRLIATLQEQRGRANLLVSLLNATGAEVYAPKRMALDNLTAPEPNRDVWYEVTDQLGRRESFGCANWVPALRGRDFERLGDGESFGMLLPLDLCYDFLSGQRYTVRVHLKYTPIEGARIVQRAVVEEVVSAPVEFTYGGPDPMDVVTGKLASPLRARDAGSGGASGGKTSRGKAAP